MNQYLGPQFLRPRDVIDHYLQLLHPRDVEKSISTITASQGCHEFINISIQALSLKKGISCTYYFFMYDLMNQYVGLQSLLHPLRCHEMVHPRDVMNQYL